MEDNKGDDFEIGDVENFQSDKDLQFSHSALVMSAMRKCLDAANAEMKAGYWQQKLDKKGNVIQTYIEDTRRKFISAVIGAELIMCCDFDNDTKKNIDALKEKIDAKHNELAKENTEAWKNTPTEIQKQNPHIEGYITIPFLQDIMTEYQLEVYRDILAELTMLTKRLDFYKAERFEG